MDFLFEQSAQQNIAKRIIATSVNVTNRLPASKQDNHHLSSRDRKNVPAKPSYNKFHPRDKPQAGQGASKRVAVFSYPPLHTQRSEWSPQEQRTLWCWAQRTHGSSKGTTFCPHSALPRDFTVTTVPFPQGFHACPGVHNRHVQPVSWWQRQVINIKRLCFKLGFF